MFIKRFYAIMHRTTIVQNKIKCIIKKFEKINIKIFKIKHKKLVIKKWPVLST